MTSTSRYNNEYSVGSSHPFFDEILQLFLAVISLELAIRQEAVEDALHTVVGEAQRMADAFNRGRPFRSVSIIDVPPLDKDVPLIDLSCREACILTNPSPIVEYLKNKLPKPSSLSFKLVRASSMSIAFGNARPTKQAQAPWISDLACFVVGSAYEKSRRHFSRKYGAVHRWPPSLEFFRHMRNGCFHGNTFNLRRRRDGSDQIDAKKPPQWRTYVMPNDAAINGKQVIDEFFHLPLLPAFLADMGAFARPQQ